MSDLPVTYNSDYYEEYVIGAEEKGLIGTDHVNTHWH